MKVEILIELQWKSYKYSNITHKFVNNSSSFERLKNG